MSPARAGFAAAHRRRRLSTRTRRPFALRTSMRRLPTTGVDGADTGVGTSGVISAGTKPSIRLLPRLPACANCRQRYSCARETPCFCAVAETWRPSPEKPSSRILSLAAAVKRRRRPGSMISSRLTGVRKLSICLSIATKRQIHPTRSRRRILGCSLLSGKLAVLAALNSSNRICAARTSTRRFYSAGKAASSKPLALFDEFLLHNLRRASAGRAEEISPSRGFCSQSSARTGKCLVLAQWPVRSRLRKRGSSS